MLLRVQRKQEKNDLKAENPSRSQIIYGDLVETLGPYFQIYTHGKSILIKGDFISPIDACQYNVFRGKDSHLSSSSLILEGE